MSSIIEQFRDFLKFFRERKGLSYADVGRRIDVPASYISAIEKGKRGISIEMMEKIAAALDVNLSLDIDFETKKGIFRLNAFKIDLRRKDKRVTEEFYIKDHSTPMAAYKKALKKISSYRPLDESLGMYYNIKNHAILAYFAKNGNQRYGNFPIKKSGGIEKALKKAIDFRVSGLIATGEIGKERLKEQKELIERKFKKKYSHLYN